MSSHPDADAFVRGFLRNPKDETTRLVFADWLEDTGEPHNAAWAGYIRAKASAARAEFGSPEWRAADREAGRFADHVRADLRLSVGFFLLYPASLLRLIPGPNLNLRLAGHSIPLSVIELVPESVARENVLFPLDLQGNVLLAASDDPANWDTVQKLAFILNRSVVLVGAPTDEVEAAINDHYGQTETEVVESVTYIFPDLSSAGGDDARSAGGLFVSAFQLRAAGFEVELGPVGGRVTYLSNDRGEAVGGPVPEQWATVSELAFARLLDHLDGLTVGRRTTADGLLRREVEVPAAITDRFPIDFEVRDGEQPPRWLRVVFRWERLYPEPPPRRRRL